jgi:DNA-binding transcriptional ArsR family regulator
MLNKEQNLDRMFHALADGNRRALIDSLMGGPATVSALAQPMAISLPAVMQHLAVLENSGLVRTEKSGRVRICSLDPGAMSEVEGWVGARRQMWENRLDQLGRFLTRNPEDKE